MQKWEELAYAREEGYESGEASGYVKGLHEIIQNMYVNNKSVEEIIEITGVSEEKVRELIQMGVCL